MSAYLPLDNWRRWTPRDWSRMEDLANTPGREKELGSLVASLLASEPFDTKAALDDLFCFGVALRKAMPRDKAGHIFLEFRLAGRREPLIAFTCGLAGRPLSEAFAEIENGTLPDFLTIREETNRLGGESADRNRWVFAQ